MLGFHYSALVERISKLFPRWIIILTGKMNIELHISKVIIVLTKDSPNFILGNVV